MNALPPSTDRPDGSTELGRPVPNAGAAAELPDAEHAPAGNAAADDALSARRQPLPNAVTALSAVLALLAVTIAGFLWWQYRQFYVALHTTDTELESALERVRASGRSLSDQIDEMRAALDASRERSELLAQRLQDLPAGFADLDRRLGDLPRRVTEMQRQIDSVQGGSTNTRATWTRAEAEYYLSVANTELGLAGRWDTAIAALELADSRLRALADPGVNRVREQIAAELLALRSVQLPDLEGLMFTLATLADKVDELPLRAAAPSNYERPREPLEDAEPGLERLWLGVKGALRGIVSIERNDMPALPELSAEMRSLARRQLAMELQLARLAALQGQEDTFESSLRAAAALLNRDFDRDAAAVSAAAALLRDTLSSEIAPPRPDISRSLAMLRTLATGNE